MIRLKSLGAILVVAGLLGMGCGGDLVKKMNELADEACACKDKACAEKVNQKIEDALKDAKEPSKADAEKIRRRPFHDVPIIGLLEQHKQMS